MIKDFETQLIDYIYNSNTNGIKYDELEENFVKSEHELMKWYFDSILRKLLIKGIIILNEQDKKYYHLINEVVLQ